MKFERLTMVNFCKHRYRVVDFNAGMTAIIGPNGSGKSNIMDALRFAMTGENPYSGTKQANISYLAPPTERSYVELVFSHGSIRVTVRRNIRPVKPTATMVIENGETIEGDTEVTRRIEQILDVTTKTLNDIVIVAQREIFSFLDEQPAKRAELFQRLYKTEIAGELYKVIGDHMKTVVIPSAGVDFDDLQRQFQASSTRVSQLQQQLAAFPAEADLQKQRDTYLLVLSQSADVISGQQQLHQLDNRISDLSSAATKVRTDMDKAITDRSVVLAASTGNKESANDARVKLATLQQSRQNHQVRENTVKRIDARRFSITEHERTAPQKPENYVIDMAAITKVREELFVNYSRIKQFVGSIKGDTVECPTCFTPATQLRPKWEEASKQLPEVVNQLKLMDAAIAATNNYNQAVQHHEQLKSQLHNLLMSEEKQLESLPPVVLADLNEAELNQTLTLEKTYADGLADMDRFIAELSRSIANYDGQLTTLQTQRTELKQKLGTLPTHAADYVTAVRTDFANIEQVIHSRLTTSMYLLTESQNVTNLTQQVQQVSAIVEEAAMLRAWHAHCQAMRDVVHKDAAPRFVAQRNLQRLQTKMNEYLRAFNSDLQVEADEGLTFQTFIPDGTKQPAERLSEGQQVVLAVAFRLAINLAIASNIGALYLDEPTAYLDENHIRGFEPVLRQLHDFTQSRGLQVIIVTHERSLAPLFDAVIDLT